MSCSESVVIIVNNCKKSFFCDYILNMSALLSEWSKELDSSSSMFLHARVQIPQSVRFFFCSREQHPCERSILAKFESDWPIFFITVWGGTARLAGRRRQLRQREALMLILLPGVSILHKTIED